VEFGIGTIELLTLKSITRWIAPFTGIVNPRRKAASHARRLGLGKFSIRPATPEMECGVTDRETQARDVVERSDDESQIVHGQRMSDATSDGQLSQRTVCAHHGERDAA
jgi:hypothetical protein